MYQMILVIFQQPLQQYDQSVFPRGCPKLLKVSHAEILLYKSRLCSTHAPMQCFGFPALINSIYANRFEIFAMTVVVVSTILFTRLRTHSLCNATTLIINPRLSTSTTTGSTFSPGLSSVYNLSMVPLEPPAPAALVLVGLAFFTVSL